MIQIVNDSARDRSTRSTAWRWLVGVNGLGALISGGFAVAGLIDPTAIGDGVATPLVELYAEAYAARALPLTAVLLYLLARGRPTTTLAPMLMVAGLAQLGDAVIGVRAGQPGVLTGGTLLAAIHLTSALWLRRDTDGSRYGVRACGLPHPRA